MPQMPHTCETCGNQITMAVGQRHWPC
ncbi:MAG: hypothetical protein JWP03_1374, partial [Phycisphaerales bacterium]|nr:hypothetical protein [Phycisphaerales bacterium]